MLGSAVQVRPLLPSTEKAAQTGGLFCGRKVSVFKLADPALFLLGTAQEGLPVQVRPLLPSTKKAAYRAAFFVRPSSGIRSCGSGPSPRKGGFEPPGRIPEASFSSVRCSVSETRCNGGAFRDRSSHPWPLLVWPSLAKQLPPGTTIAPLTWQRNRHGSAPPLQRERPDLSTKLGL